MHKLRNTVYDPEGSDPREKNIVKKIVHTISNQDFHNTFKANKLSSNVLLEDFFDCKITNIF